MSKSARRRMRSASNFMGVMRSIKKQMELEAEHREQRRVEQVMETPMGKVRRGINGTMELQCEGEEGFHVMDQQENDQLNKHFQEMHLLRIKDQEDKKTKEQLDEKVKAWTGDAEPSGKSIVDVMNE